jgi:hypothetical protein
MLMSSAEQEEYRELDFPSHSFTFLQFNIEGSRGSIIQQCG